MAVRVVIVCDWPDCGTPDATTWEIRQDDRRRWTVQLCQEHSKPLLELVGHGQGRMLDEPNTADIARHFGPFVRNLGGEVLDGART